MSLLSEFLQVAPPGTARTLAALACAESLTDNVALAIYEEAPTPGLAADDFVSAFKYSGLTEPRNSEWNLDPTLRQELIGSAELDAEDRHAVHHLLLSLSLEDTNRPKAGTEVPSYLFTEAGRAYHFAGAGKLDEALAHYGEASKGGLTGAQWLGAKLAAEQERTGVIPPGQVETTFLRAWVLWREGNRREAMPLFRKVAASDAMKREVAISLHIVGNDNNRGQRRGAEQELRRSIEIDDHIGNPGGVAQTLHSLANMLTRQDRFEAAEGAYRQSIEIDERLGNRGGVAQTLHSLANMLTRQERFDEAQKAYEQSIKIGETIGNQFHVAQTLHDLANMFTRQNRFEAAEEAYRRSIKIDDRLGNQGGVAQTLHSLANMLTRLDQFDAAEEAYRQSIKIDDSLGDRFGVAQTLHSLANLLIRQDRFDEAERTYQRSIEIGEELKNDNHLAQVLRSYALALEPDDPDRAVSLLEQSREINRRSGNLRYVRLVERDLRRLQNRGKN